MPWLLQVSNLTIAWKKSKKFKTEKIVGWTKMVLQMKVQQGFEIFSELLQHRRFSLIIYSKKKSLQNHSRACNPTFSSNYKYASIAKTLPCVRKVFNKNDEQPN